MFDVGQVFIEFWVQGRKLVYARVEGVLLLANNLVLYIMFQLSMKSMHVVFYIKDYTATFSIVLSVIKKVQLVSVQLKCLSLYTSISQI